MRDFGRHVWLLKGACNRMSKNIPDQKGYRLARYVRGEEKDVQMWHRGLTLVFLATGTDWLDVPTKYPHKIWPYMVLTYLHFRILEISHWFLGPAFLKEGISFDVRALSSGHVRVHVTKSVAGGFGHVGMGTFRWRYELDSIEIQWDFI